jgi:hypothetical protein
MVTDMTITPALTERVRAAVDATGWTWKEVQDHGGPSSTTMTDIVAGRYDKPISVKTCRKLDAAFRWALGTARSLVDPDYTPPATTEAPQGVEAVPTDLTPEVRARLEVAMEAARAAARQNDDTAEAIARILGL